MDFRSRHAEEGAVVAAAEGAVWDSLAVRLAAADDVAAEATAREWALGELERLGVQRPAKIPAAGLRAVAE